MLEPQRSRTVRSAEGKVLLFSCEDFVRDICEGDACFICGAPAGSTPFNNEHVIPRWLLRRFDLFDRKITLPNGRVHTYGRYGVPCCRACNTFLGDRLETPVSQLLEGGHEAVFARLDGDAVRLLFIWVTLIFLKTHLKDRLLPVDPDPRNGAGMLDDAYDWREMHHLHAVARSVFTGAVVEPEAIGSMLFLVIDDDLAQDRFDWIDLTFDQTVALQVGEVGIIAVLNDSGAAKHAWGDAIAAIDGSLTSTQMRELAARMATANLDLENRPVFGTTVGVGPDQAVTIWGRHEDAPRFAALDPNTYGDKLAYVLRDRLDHLRIDNVVGADAVRERLKAGDATFLFREDGTFQRGGGAVAMELVREQEDVSADIETEPEFPAGHGGDQA